MIWGGTTIEGNTRINKSQAGVALTGLDFSGPGTWSLKKPDIFVTLGVV